MEIKFLHRDQIDDLAWDECVSRSFNSLIYAYTWYLDEVCNDDWDGLVHGDYTAVMPLPRRRKWGFTYAYQPYFCQQLGIFSTTDISKQLATAFFNAIPSHYCFVHLQVNTFTRPDIPKLKTEERTNHRLPLIPVYEKLASAYNDNTRRNLKKAKAAELQPFENADPGVIIKFYKDNYAGKTPEIKEPDYLRLNRLVNMAIKTGSVKAWGVYDGHNTLCAGAIFLTDHKNTYYLLGGADEYGRDNGAMHALFDAFIERYAGHDLVLDFEGSEIEGISRFYKGLGAKQVNYHRVKINRLPWIVRWLKEL